jgi:hypothetical protein
MAFVPFSRAAALTVNYLWLGQQVQNTLWFDYNDAIDETALESLVADVETYVFEEMLPLMSEDIFLNSVEARKQDAPESLYAISRVHSNEPGGVPTPSMPNNVTVSVSFRTALTGRSRRGRNYWLAIPTTQVADNLVNGSYLEGVLGAYEGMIGLGAVSAGWQWVVASKYANGAQREQGLTTNVTGVTIVDNIVDSQRRRLPGRGA